jgi:hypothetical protein
MEWVSSRDYSTDKPIKSAGFGEFTPSSKSPFYGSVNLLYLDP